MMRRISLLLLGGLLCLMTMHCSGSPTCNNQCLKGQRFCSARGLLFCQFDGPTGCFRWMLQVCPPGSACVNGTKPSCSSNNQCSQKYHQRRCVGLDVYWFDNCGRPRERAIACPANTRCFQGTCVQQNNSCVSQCKGGDSLCSPSGLISRCTWNAQQNCMQWSRPEPCPTGKYCVFHSCSASRCQNVCNEGGQRCVGGQIQRCEKQSNGCTDWGPARACQPGYSCEGSTCVPSRCPAACSSSRECDIPSCGIQRECRQGLCRSPKALCPASCTTDAECKVPACGVLRACGGGRCIDPAQLCPNACRIDVDCRRPGCGSRTQCRGGRCMPPIADPEPSRDAGVEPTREPSQPDRAPSPDSANPDTSKPDNSSSASAWKYGRKVKFIAFPAQNQRNNSAWGPVLKDIVNHEAPGDTNNYTDLVTLGHETCHGIHAYLRNNYNKTGKKANAFYVLNSQAVIVVEPNMRKREVQAYVPTSLRGSRYNLYIVGSTSWDDRPLYIYDEWVAYVNGSATGVDLVKQGKWKYPWRDAVAGTLEFTIYAIATAMAVEKKDPTYFKNETQFLEFTAWMAARGMQLYREGSKMKDFKWAKQEAFYKTFTTSADADAMRKFAIRVFGQRWFDQVMLGKS